MNEKAQGRNELDHKCAFCRRLQGNEIKQLRKLMKKNNPQAFIQMGSKYESGEGVFQSNTKSLEMYIRAAELGHVEAYYKIGILYRDGIAVEQDKSKSLAFWEISAKKGSISAS